MLEHPLQQRQREGGRFAGAGLRRTHHVAALQHDRNRLRLNRRHGCIAQLRNSSRERFGQLELRERIEPCGLSQRGGGDVSGRNVASVLLGFRGY